MKRFQIITWELGPSGWVEVADDGAVSYEYDGPDPNNRIVPFLEDLRDGSMKFYLSCELGPENKEISPAKKLVEIASFLDRHDPIFGVVFHDDFVFPDGR
jgi:hypothetical protein